MAVEDTEEKDVERRRTKGWPGVVVEGKARKGSRE